MDKRMAINKEVKDKITEAFFSLLKNPDISEEEITITGITRLAGVSRMAYYRNFSSRLGIIEYYLKEIVWKDIENSLSEGVSWGSVEYYTQFYRIMKEHKDNMLLLDSNGYSGMILNIFNETNELLAGDMPVNSIERFSLYFSAGAAFNSAMVWLRDGCMESPEEMAEYRQAVLG